MAIRIDESDGVLRLFAPTDSRCVAHIAARAWVNVAHLACRVGFAGRAATVVTNHDRNSRYWHDVLNRWLPGDPGAAVLIEITVFEGRSWTVAAPAERLPAHIG